MKPHITNHLADQLPNEQLNQLTNFFALLMQIDRRIQKKENAPTAGSHQEVTHEA